MESFQEWVYNGLVVVIQFDFSVEDAALFQRFFWVQDLGLIVKGTSSGLKRSRQTMIPEMAP